MCGRFTQRYTWREIHDLYDLTGTARNLQAHYNIAPTDTVDVVRSASGVTELVSMRWGLIPFWWKMPLKRLPASFNARAESVADTPMFRDAFKRHRCIIPASGYYEWIARPDGKQPFFISAADGGVLSFAGLWDRWKKPDTDERVVSCTIIVTDANAHSRSYAGFARQGEFQAMAERRCGCGHFDAGSRRPRSLLAGVQARQQDRQRR
jgi:putative SOS response-associated peptidase YedK